MYDLLDCIWLILILFNQIHFIFPPSNANWNLIFFPSQWWYAFRSPFLWFVVLQLVSALVEGPVRMWISLRDEIGGLPPLFCLRHPYLVTSLSLSWCSCNRSSSSSSSGCSCPWGRAVRSFLPWFIYPISRWFLQQKWEVPFISLLIFVASQRSAMYSKNGDLPVFFLLLQNPHFLFLNLLSNYLSGWGLFAA